MAVYSAQPNYSKHPIFSQAPPSHKAQNIPFCGSIGPDGRDDIRQHIENTRSVTVSLSDRRLDTTFDIADFECIPGYDLAKITFSHKVPNVYNRPTNCLVSAFTYVEDVGLYTIASATLSNGISTLGQFKTPLAPAAFADVFSTPDSHTNLGKFGFKFALPESPYGKTLVGDLFVAGIKYGTISVTFDGSGAITSGSLAVTTQIPDATIVTINGTIGDPDIYTITGNFTTNQIMTTTSSPYTITGNVSIVSGYPVFSLAIDLDTDVDIAITAVPIVAAAGGQSIDNPFEIGFNNLYTGHRVSCAGLRLNIQMNKVSRLCHYYGLNAYDEGGVQLANIAAYAGLIEAFANGNPDFIMAQFYALTVADQQALRWERIDSIAYDSDDIDLKMHLLYVPAVDELMAINVGTTCQEIQKNTTFQLKTTENMSISLGILGILPQNLEYNDYHNFTKYVVMAAPSFKTIVKSKIAYPSATPAASLVQLKRGNMVLFENDQSDVSQQYFEKFYPKKCVGLTWFIYNYSRMNQLTNGTIEFEAGGNGYINVERGVDVPIYTTPKVFCVRHGLYHGKDYVRAPTKPKPAPEPMPAIESTKPAVSDLQELLNKVSEPTAPNAPVEACKCVAPSKPGLKMPRASQR